MNIPSVARPFFALCILLALSACDGAYDYDASAPPSQDMQQSAAPSMPQAPIETIPVIADPQAEIWRPGYWILEYRRFVWVPGKIIARPSPTAVWATSRWVHHTYGWSFQEGHWE